MLRNSLSKKVLGITLSNKAVLMLKSPFYPGEAVKRLLGSPHRKAAVVTDGVNGVWFAGEGDTTVRYQAAFSVTVCDTTGCGDVFHGAYAASLTFGMALPDRVRFATAAAALKAARKGGQTGAPTQQEVVAFLEKHAGEQPT